MKVTAITVCAFVVLTYLGKSEAVSGFTETAFTITAGASSADITGSVTAKQAENIAAATELFTLTATKDANGAVTYDFTAAGNPGDVAAITTTADVASVKLAAGKSLDFETSPAITFVITATEVGSATIGTATLTLSVTNALEFSAAALTACVVDGSAAGTAVGTYTVSDAASAAETVAYSITGTTDFTYDGTTGALTVSTGTTIASATTATYTLTLTATPGGTVTSAVGTAQLVITVASTCSGAAQLTAVLSMLMLAILAAVSF